MFSLIFRRTPAGLTATLGRVAKSRPILPTRAILGVTVTANRTFLTSAVAPEPAAATKTKTKTKTGAKTTKKLVKKATTGATPAATKKAEAAKEANAAKKKEAQAAKRKETQAAAELKSAVREVKPPKRPLTAYFMFLAEQKASAPPFTSLADANAFAKETGAKWQALSDAEKKRYLDKQSAALEEWKPQYAEYMRNVPRDVLKALNQKRKARGMPRMHAHPADRKPVGPYLRFVEEFSPEFAKTFEGEKFTFVRHMGKAAGERWRGMSEAEKAPYKEKFQEDVVAWRARQPSTSSGP